MDVEWMLQCVVLCWHLPIRARVVDKTQYAEPLLCRRLVAMGGDSEVHHVSWRTWGVLQTSRVHGLAWFQRGTRADLFRIQEHGLSTAVRCQD